MNETGSVERSSDLKDIHQAFQVQGKRLDECRSRLINISNRLSISDELQKEPSGKNDSKRSPGLLNDFRTTADQFASLISEVEIQLSRLDSKI